MGVKSSLPGAGGQGLKHTMWSTGSRGGCAIHSSICSPRRLWTSRGHFAPPPDDKHSNVYHRGGSARGPREAQRRRGLHILQWIAPPPGILVYSLSGSAPGPRPRGDYF